MYIYIYIYVYVYVYVSIYNIHYTNMSTNMCVYIYIYIYPPTPAASRGSALEEDLLATRGQRRKADTQEEGKKREAARSGQARRREEARSSKGFMLELGGWKTASFLIASESSVRTGGRCPQARPVFQAPDLGRARPSKLEAGSAGRPAE